MKKVLAAALVAVLFCGSFANAEDKPKKDKDPKAQFTKLDKDGDGKVSLAEFVGKKDGEKKEKAEKAFNKKDKDSDGSLTMEEFTAAPKKKKDK